MKFLLTALLAVVAFTNTIKAQDEGDWHQYVKLSYTINKIDDSHGELVITGKIAPGWHVYAVAHDPAKADLTGAKPYINWISKTGYKLEGKLYDGAKPTVVEDDMGTSVEFLNKCVFKQKFVATGDKPFKLSGQLNFQVCDENGCKFPSEVFNVTVNDLKADAAEVTPATDNANNDTVADTKASVNTKKNQKEDKDTEKETKTEKKESQSLLGVFFLAFFSGFAALVMPCVFPMIPMTVSFFTKRSKTRAMGIRNAFLYGGSIVLIHVLLGGIVVITGAGHILNELSTNVYFNIFFFLMLLVFGLSFLGAFEIQLPAKWTNKADEKADKGGVIGIFFMALVLSLASFSCTGPILGSLLVGISSSGGGSALMMGMFAFGLALALPFMLFALFPSWLNAMPSSGGWLNVVKVFLGFLEIAFAFKFLSTADTTMQWHLLEREVFISIWIAVFGTLALYMLGKIRLPHDSPVEKLSVGRTMIATLTLAFTMYLIPGLWGAPLNLVNAFLPPTFYAESPKGVGGGGAQASSTTHLEEGMHEGPQGIPAFQDYDKALAYAKKVNKPLFIDFTGWGCVNCRKMESTVWGKPGVIEHLKNDFVIVSLYVDERTELPAKEQKTIKVNGNDFLLFTIGNKWTAKQINEYKTSSQPYYVLQTPDGKDIPVGSADYQNHSDPKVFKAWLEKGLKKVKS